MRASQTPSRRNGTNDTQMVHSMIALQCVDDIISTSIIVCCTALS